MMSKPLDDEELEQAWLDARKDFAKPPVWQKANDLNDLHSKANDISATGRSPAMFRKP